ncbi:MAG: TIGR04211 family SH3 domain-containing protein [Deltaproteobacteria bacterium]|nr:TIGR04211 family SH3 domain-containing protein [Deltaproteobacteria bacterium]
MKHARIRDAIFILPFALLTLSPATVRSAHADTRYVTDMLILSLREGPGSEYNVIRMLQSDAPVEILEENETYLRVRTEEGEEGWVAKQYISSNTPKPVIIAGLRKEVGQLESRVEELEKGRTVLLEKLKATGESTSKSREEAFSAKNEIKQLAGKYDKLVSQSKNVVELVAERDRVKTANDALRTANDELKAEIEDLTQDNESLIRRRILAWFLAGGGVFFVGLIVGKLSRKKKYY